MFCFWCNTYRYYGKCFGFRRTIIFKKSDYKANGNYPISIASLNGCFSYAVKRLKIGTSSGSFFSLTDYFDNPSGKKNHYQSVGLRDFATKYATKLSYANVCELIKDVCKGTTLSSQHIYSLVQIAANEITHKQKEKIAIFEASATVLKAEKSDIYSASNEEMIYLSDDVCVKEQKAKRDKQPKTKGKRHNTRISMFEDGLKEYKTVVAGIGVDNIQLVKALICEAYPLKTHKLPVVAITDGATNIKNELKTIFGENFMHILDWYHLQKKVKETMTMILPKTHREAHCQHMLNLLWNGKSVETIAYLETISAKNDASKAMLITYLGKNENTIIDYERRKMAGKTIGSGRTEKENDILVAKRQKYNGMAWSPKGSLAITLVTASYY